MARAVGRGGSRQRTARLGVLVAVAVALGAAPGEATVREWLMQQQGLDPQILGATPSVRLMGLGNLGLAVVDEGNELNLRDFSGNVAGILDDSDRWVLESWLGNHVQLADREAFSAERRYGHSGIHVVYRSATRALGSEVNWGYLETEDNPGDWNRVRGPLVSGLVNQRIGPLTVGLMLGRESEREDRHSNDFFSIRHSQDRWIGRCGIQGLLAGWVLGAEWQFESGDLEGVSIDPARFHEDTYTWSRPADRYTIAAVLPRRGSLEGGLRLGLMDREGSERARISWSDRSPQNPSQTNYFDDVVTFREAERVLELASRWRLHVGERTRVGAEVTYRDWEQEVTEGINFKGSLASGSWTTDELGLGLGMSRGFLSGRILATLEGRLQQEDWTAADRLERSSATARNLLLGFGLEFFARPDLAVRGAVAAGASDLDIDAPLTMRSGRLISGGISWLPRGGLLQLTGAISYARWEPAEAEATQLETEDTTGFAVSLRLLL